jgi:hypothetical protein
MSFPENLLVVKGGDISLGPWGFAANFINQGDILIELDLLQSCVVVSDRHESFQTGMGRVAGGILGAALLGPIGAAGGLLAGGKRRIDETIILCRLFDGRTFTAECSQLTAAKFSQIANFNLISKASSNNQIDVTSIQHAPKTLKDTTECPMCAEFIKSKAKVCRYCGYKVAEERNARINAVKTDADTDEIHSFGDLYLKYVDNVTYEEFFSESDVRLILIKFIELHVQNPDATYRQIVDLVKEDLGLEYKTPLLDLFREGFSFTRKNVKFKFISEDDLIVVSKSPW